MGKRKNPEAPTSTSLRWTVRMDKVFIDALLHEDVCGNRVDGNFTSKAYDNVLKECTNKLEFPFTKEHLKNRLKTIKSNFAKVYDLFGASGWGWSGETELFENEDEVWDSLIEPEAKKWKNTPFRHYNLLVKLFSKDRAIDDDGATAKEKRLRSMTNDESSDKTGSTVDAKLDESKDSADCRKGKRKVLEEFLKDEISSVKQGLDNVAQALREGNQLVERGRQRVYTPEEIFEEVAKMEFDGATRRAAYRFLNMKQSRIRELVGFPVEEQKEYLIDMMHAEDL